MGVYDFRLPLDFFEQLTFAEFCDIAYRHSLSQEREQFFYWQICAHIRWALGDKESGVRNLVPPGISEVPVLTEPAQAESNPQAAMERRFLAAMTSIVGITSEPA